MYNAIYMSEDIVLFSYVEQTYISGTYRDTTWWFDHAVYVFVVPESTVT